MTGRHTTLVQHADELRDAFDRSFAEPPRAGQDRYDHVLAIRVAGEPYAVRLHDVAGLHVGWPVTPLPGPSPELLGIAAFQGSLVPVYDLSALLGRTGPGTYRWIVLTAGTGPVAFAFDGLDGHLRVAPDLLATGAGAGRPVVRWAGSAWTVLSLPDLVATLRSRRPDGRLPTIAGETRGDGS
jgi:purine-binding chemotaxis protein CheW